MKALIKIILFVSICGYLTACDSGIKLVGFEIAKYPDKLFYVIGIDEELNLEGGAVYYITKDDQRRLSRLIAQPMTDFDLTIISDIDFNRAGIYVVELNYVNDFAISFPIQVISLDEIKSIVESTIECQTTSI